MTITSFGFYIFLAICLLIYWEIPTRFQWIFLLIISLVFYVFNAPVYTLIYLLGTLLVTYKATLSFQKDVTVKHKRVVLLLALFVNIGMLTFFKYIPWNTIIGEEADKIIAPLAISFYTLQMIAYLLDTYWGIIVPERNYLKLALYNIFFPQMVSGPISRFSDLSKQLFEEHRYDYARVANAMKRIAWGLVKKLLIASKIGMIVDAIFDNPAQFTGIYIWFAIFAFMVQLYADFSGCMDIVLGISECFGITLTENFNAPFLSSSVQEFWQRWHITLGTWLRDYIMNPILKSNPMISLGSWCKKVFGKKNGKKIPVYIAMFFVWTAMGIWHGNGIKYIVGEGWWFWITIVLSQMAGPLKKRIMQRIGDKAVKVIIKPISVVWTAILVCIGFVFFRADSMQTAFDMLGNGFSQTIGVGEFKQELLWSGVSLKDLGGGIGVLFVCINCILLLIIEVLQYKSINPVLFLNRRNKMVRWTIYWLLSISVMLSIFDTVKSFIYAGF